MNEPAATTQRWWDGGLASGGSRAGSLSMLSRDATGRPAEEQELVFINSASTL
jgi:hypothetical protein